MKQRLLWFFFLLTDASDTADLLPEAADVKTALYRTDHTLNASETTELHMSHS